MTDAWTATRDRWRVQETAAPRHGPRAVHALVFALAGLAGVLLALWASQ